MAKPTDESSGRRQRAYRIVDGILSSCSVAPDLAEAALSTHAELAPEIRIQLQRLEVIEQAQALAESGKSSNDDHDAEQQDTAAHRVGPADFPGYRIKRRISRGGQGVVYEAVQVATRRTVAIKFTREGPFAGEHDQARFQREIHILAALKHPHIVTIHDSGVAQGRHYFVMDYIEGKPLDEYVSGTGMSIDELLRLFSTICDAVNSAHLRGIIHRDLKCSNILVDGDGNPHVLDFGLAKMTDADDEGIADARAVTRTGQFLGSLPWASPEQVEGDPDRVDLRSDVYALGVILYQMLTGGFPYAVVGGVREVMDNIISAEPIRASTVSPRIDDEVDTIVLQCLSKLPERRYQSAGELVRDIERYLGGRPIEARRDSTWYVIKKALRRHRVATAAATTFMLLVAGAAVGMSVLYSRANEEARTANRVLFCLDSLFGDLETMRHASREVSVRDLLDRGAQRVAEELRDEPEAQSRLMRTFATIYSKLGLHERSLQLFRKVAALQGDVLGNSDRAMGNALADLARMLHLAGHYDEADARYEEAINRLSRVAVGVDADRVKVLLSYGAHLQNKGDYQSARTVFDEALRDAREVQSGDHRLLYHAISGVGGLLHDTGDYDAAETHYREALAMQHRLHPGLRGQAEFLGLLYKDMGNYAAAEPLIRESLEAKLERFGRDSTPVARSYLNLAKLHTDSGAFTEAEAACRTALELSTLVFGEEHRNTARPMTLLGRILVAVGRYAEAEPLLRRALEIRNTRKPPGHWKTAKTESVLGSALTGLLRFQEAEPLLLHSHAIIAADRGAASRRTAEATQRIVDLYDSWGNREATAKWRARLSANEVTSP